MEPKTPDAQDKKYLDISLSVGVAYAVGFCAPPILIFQLSNAASLSAWVVMLLASFLVLKLRNKSRFVEALAQSVLVSCVVTFVFLATAAILLGQIMPALCC